jgi:hypothetical protein
LVNDLNLITGWLPSPIDLIIDDWIILD